MRELVIVSAQLNFTVGDIYGNTERIIQETQKAVAQYQADLVVFPELALCGYPPEDLLLRPGFYRRCQKALQTIVEATQNTCIMVGYPEKADIHYFNKVAVIQNQKVIATYAKQDLPNYTVFDEKRYFNPGTSPCVINLKGLKIGVLICEDVWHDGPAQQSVAAGAQIIVTLNASPYDRYQVRARQHILKERALKTRTPIIYVNLVGGQDELVFDGGSMVIGKDGQHVVQGHYYQEELLPIKITLDDTPKIIPQPIPMHLSEEENIYKTLVLGVSDYIRKNNFPGAVLGLSGGIDSALTLAIAVDALGADKVHAVMMPSRYTSDISLIDAEQQAKTMGVRYDVIEIEAIFKAFLTALEPQFSGTKANTAEENLQARIRGTLLMAISNKNGNIVLTTGNKSEMSVGYATLYGDMAGGFAVIKDIPKTLVYRLAHYRNQLSPTIPERVIERPPSAELREGQTDQDSLPPYPILDEILERFIEYDEDPVDIAASGIDADTVNRVVRMVMANEYKRRQAPVGIRTTQRAFGRDRRYPITSGYSKNL